MTELPLTKADQAKLRRGVDPWEVRGFYALQRKYPDRNPRFLAMAAPLLAEIREITDKPIGELCRRRKLSEYRMRRLLASRDREDLVHQLRGVVRILGRQANPDELVDLVNFWGGKMEARRRIARDYFKDTDDDVDG